jgi:hypothetical protein
MALSIEQIEGRRFVSDRPERAPFAGGSAEPSEPGEAGSQSPGVVAAVCRLGRSACARILALVAPEGSTQ